MSLHTAQLIDPRVGKVTTLQWLWWLLRIVVIESKDSKDLPVYKPRFVAISLLNRLKWRKCSEIVAIHEAISDPMKGLLAGKTFEEVLGEGSVLQNRVLLQKRARRHIPFLIRVQLRGLENATHWWVNEYSFRGRVSTGKTYRYCTIVEFIPLPWVFPARHQLGASRVWWLMGRAKQFLRYLSLQEPTVPAKPKGFDGIVWRVAKVAAWVPAHIMPALLYVLARPALKQHRESEEATPHLACEAPFPTAS